MPTTIANGIEICYDEFGATDAPAMLLIMGYRAQMIAWHPEFCGALADEGFHVIRFDNRDCGLSYKTPGPPPEPGVAAPYTLSDMAADAVGLLDALGIERAHIVGASMGGMIAQLVAINHPERTLSLTSIMSTTGKPAVGGATPEAMAALTAPLPTDRDAVIARSVETYRIIGGSLFDEEEGARRAAAAFDRSFYPVGAAFQMAAIIADGDRTERLAGVRCPTLVIHGAADTLVQPSGGAATAAAIPGADLLVFDEMGHDLPRPLWPELVSAIVKNAARA